jgi:hypothetical protein
MPAIRSPKNTGYFSLRLPYAGKEAVALDKSGGNNFIIACKSKNRTEELYKKLNKQMIMMRSGMKQ